MLDLLTNNMWIVWLVLLIIFLSIEMLTLELTSLMLGAGAAVALLTSFFKTPILVQAIVFLVFSILSIFVIRPPLLAKIHKTSEETATNSDALKGKLGKTLETITESAGLVRLDNGETWSARIPMNQSTIAPEVLVKVLSVSGATILVECSEIPTQLKEDFDA